MSLVPTFRLALALATAASVAGVACGGITDPADYRAATAGFTDAADRLEKLTDGDHPSADVARANDGLSMGSAFEKVIPAAESMRRSLDGIDVKAPELKAAHDDLVAAADAHVAELTAVRDELSSSVFSDSKKRLAASVATFQDAVAAWDEAVGEP